MTRDDLDPLAILSTLGVSVVDRVTPVSGGWDTALWRVDSGRQSFALRVFRADQAETCRREARVMRALHELDLPVPGVHAEISEGARPALLLSWCPGRTVLHEARERPWRVWRLGVAMGRMQARIHAVPLADALRQALPAWMPRPEDGQPDLLAQVRADVDGGAVSLLHLDYHPLNVMTDGRSVTGVLDWANVAVGDWRADLARTVTILRLAPMPPGTPVILVLGLRRLLEAAWRSGYRQRRTVDPFLNLDVFYAWAGAMMERDLRPKIGRPGVWLQENDLSGIHRWTAAWNERIARKSSNG